MKIKTITAPVEFINFKIDIDVDVRISELATIKNSNYSSGNNQLACDLYNEDKCHNQANYKIEIASEYVDNKFLSAFIRRNNILKACEEHKKYLGDYTEDVIYDLNNSKKGAK